MLLNQARLLAEVESLLAGLIGQGELRNFQVAAMQHDRLVLITPTAAWATRLRMQTQTMLRFLQTSGYAQLGHIEVLVAPVARQSATPKTPKKASPAVQLALNLMSNMIQKIDSNSPK